jgi:hypothetical protein
MAKENVVQLKVGFELAKELNGASAVLCDEFRGRVVAQTELVVAPYADHVDFAEHGDGFVDTGAGIKHVAQQHNSIDAALSKCFYSGSQTIEPFMDICKDANFHRYSQTPSVNAICFYTARVTPETPRNASIESIAPDCTQTRLIGGSVSCRRRTAQKRGSINRTQSQSERSGCSISAGAGQASVGVGRGREPGPIGKLGGSVDSALQRRAFRPAGDSIGTRNWRTHRRLA